MSKHSIVSLESSEPPFEAIAKEYVEGLYIKTPLYKKQLSSYDLELFFHDQLANDEINQAVQQDKDPKPTTR